jgi:type I restriction enzyme S subunit
MRPVPKKNPPLRFPAFNDTWKRWLLDKFATRGSGHTPSKSHPEYYGGDIDWISLADSKRLDNGYIEVTKTKITDLGLRHSSAILHPAGTVLLSRDAGIGKSAVMKRSMAVSQHFIVWRPTEGTSIDWFIYYWLQIMKPEFERIAIGSTIKTIGLPYFKKLEISAPTLPEQRKIADFLTAVDGRIGQLSQKKALLEDYKKGVMQQLFTQALRFKDDHGNDFPEWKEKKFMDIFEFSTGKNIKQAEASPDFRTPCIRYGELYHMYNEVITTIINRTNIDESELKFSDGDEILLPSAGEDPLDIGSASALTIKDVAIGRTINVLKPKEHGVYEQIFVSYYINQMLRRKISTLARGASISNVYNSDLKMLEIRLPSLSEQAKIANFLTALDRKIESVAQQITHTQTFKKGLLQQMFV